MRVRVVAPILTLAAITFVLGACRKPPSSGTAYVPPASYASGSYAALLDVGSGPVEIDLACCGLDGAVDKDLYFVITNGSPSRSAILPRGAMSSADAAPNARASQPGFSRPPDPVAESRGPLIRGKPGYAEVPVPEVRPGESRGMSGRVLAESPEIGDRRTFYADYTRFDDLVPATLRYLSEPIEVSATETRTLEIWVADHAWHEGGDAANLTTEEMVDTMGRRFLAPGFDNDIYDWVRGVYGAEWGPHDHPALIPSTGRISILLLDIDADDATETGVLGYYYSRDNQLASNDPESNERIMFYMDSVFYGTRDAGETRWSVDQELPSVMLSTLAHELQHTVNFYQKSVLRGVGSKTWLNEMASLMAEDLVAQRLGVSGPRGVAADTGGAGESGLTGGRLPRFNNYNTTSLTRWSSDIESVRSDYAASYAFGAFLLRNYGGAQVAHDIVHSLSGDYAAVVEAVRRAGGDVSPDVGTAFRQLLADWGLAVLVSDVEGPDYRIEYNTGSWIAGRSLAGSQLRLGSINLYNYTFEDSGLAGPRLYRPEDLGGALTVSYPASNILVYAGRYGAARTVARWSIELPSDLTVSALVRERW